MILTIAQVRELILRKQQLEEGVATVWLTTSEMGFSLTEEPHEILCPKDVKGREKQRPISGASNIQICYGCPDRKWGRSGPGSAGPGRLAGTRSVASTMG
jgi:hypothetical protein